MNSKYNAVTRFSMPLALLVIAALAAALLLQSFNHAATEVGAQTTNPAPTAQHDTTITVSADGQASAQPDLAVINIGVQAQGATAREALTKHNDALNAVMAKLKDLKIGDADVQTTGFSIYPNYGADGRQVESYNASSNLTIKVEDMGNTGTVLDGLVSAGANTAGGISFTLKNDQQLQAQALANAVANARPKADAIAKQMGVSITGVSSIVENDVNSGPRPMMDTAMSSASGSVPIASGDLTVNANVTVVFSYGK
jgi:uncharacterized protein YggE